MRRLRISGRAIPVWLLILVFIASGIGAAVGAVLAGQIIGEIPITVSQALVIDKGADPPVRFNIATNTEDGVWSIPALPDRYFVSWSDDGTGFSAVAELKTGDGAIVVIWLANRSEKDLTAELRLVLPEGITLRVAGDSVLGKVDNFTRTGLETWLMKVDKSAGDFPGNAFLAIQFGLADDITPGFYQIKGTLKQINY